MVLRNVSARGVVLRDSGGNQYTISSYGEMNVLDALLSDVVFLKWLRFRIRDVIVIPTKPPKIVSTTEFNALSPFHGDEVYLEANASAGVRWHLIYNASSSSIYKWEFVGGTPLRHEVLTAQAISASGAWSNLTTDGPLVVTPRAGDFDARLSLNVTATAGGASNAQATIQVGNEDGVAPLIVSATATGGATVTTGSISKRLTSVAEAASIKARYFSSTSGQLPTFTNRVLEVWPVRLS